jgi:alkylated DNA repair dioxygenase AlkB
MQMRGNLSSMERIELPDAELSFWPAAFAPEESKLLFAALRAGTDWQQEEIVIFGQPRLVPRLVAWHGDADARYRYSGVMHEPRPWTAALLAIRDRVEVLTARRFNSVLLNLYRDGRDGMGWHSDDESELGLDPAIASVSLGATRRFRMRHRKNRAEPFELRLAEGGLLLMSGPTQHHWQHAVPKTARSVGERINLTFRLVGKPCA